VPVQGCILPLAFNKSVFLKTEVIIIVIIIIIITCRELHIDMPLAASYNSLFKGLPCNHHAHLLYISVEKIMYLLTAEVQLRADIQLHSEDKAYAGVLTQGRSFHKKTNKITQ
jgi:hypothetical protein